MIPIRCFTCGKEIASLYEEFLTKIRDEMEDPEKVLDSFGLTRYCCRRMLITHITLLDQTMRYTKPSRKV
ncbi:MAG: DNA-directed RNA polymerase subunit N [Promethearchaeota archaeon]